MLKRASSWPCWLFVLLSAAVCFGGTSEPTTPPPGYVLSWSDEFDGANGSLPDPSKWVMETGGKGWENNELETYTNRRQNAHVQDGNLVITANKERYTGTDGLAREYTSARIKTAGLFEQKYGRFEARIKIPQGQGMWPAFWMLGNNIDKAGWPACGEIDVMENIGKEPAIAHGSMHGPGYSGAKGLTAAYTLPSGKFADDFHIFAVEWEAAAVRFYVDGNLYETRTRAELAAGQAWVFDHPFFILLNVAVGGDWPGSPDSTMFFPRPCWWTTCAFTARSERALPVAIADLDRAKIVSVGSQFASIAIVQNLGKNPSRGWICAFLLRRSPQSL